MSSSTRAARITHSCSKCAPTCTHTQACTRIQARSIPQKGKHTHAWRRLPCRHLLEEDHQLLAGGAGSAEAEAAVREQLHDKLLPVVLALLRVDRLSGACVCIGCSGSGCRSFLHCTWCTLLNVSISYSSYYLQSHETLSCSCVHAWVCAHTCSCACSNMA